MKRLCLPGALFLCDTTEFSTENIARRLTPKTITDPRTDTRMKI